MQTSSRSVVEDTKAVEDDGERDSEVDRARQRKERKERAVKDREEKIRAERSKVEADIGKTRQGLNRGENEMEFRCAAYYAWSSFRLHGAANRLFSTL